MVFDSNYGLTVHFNKTINSDPALLAVQTSLPFQGGGVGLVFQKVLLQYFSDDIGELFGNTNVSAAAVFGNILIMKYTDVPLKLGTAKSASAEN